jgi:hypothetical protein
MRSGFAHDAVLVLDAGGDQRAPGGAITVALCGSWSHDGACPLAPHHTRADRSGDEVTVRVLFAAAPEQEGRVRNLIDEALARGETWRLVSSGPSEVRPEEAEHVGRLIRS